MKDQLISNNSNDKNDGLMKEIKKMSKIKYLNLLISIIRFLMILSLTFLILYFPSTFRVTLFTKIIGLTNVLILPLITSFFFVVVISGTYDRDFWVKKNPTKINFFNCFFCWCIMSKNVGFLKKLTLIFCVNDFIWSFILSYYLIKDFAIPNNSKFFPFSWKRIIYRIILNWTDSILLLLQFYCFCYYGYFLNRLEIYIEYYKRLIIKKRDEEASFVRNILPYDINEYVSSSGEELQNV